MLDEKEVTQDLIDSIQFAKNIVISQVPKSEKINTIRRFFDKSNDFTKKLGERAYSNTLKEIGLNEYEVEKIIDFKNQSYINDITSDFFKNINFSENYISPLSQNKNWLSVALVDKTKLTDEYGKLVEYISDTFQKNQKAEFLAILDKYIEVTSQKEDKKPFLDILKRFDHKDKFMVQLLAKEINSFGKRYSIDDQGDMYIIAESIINVNKEGKMIFNSGKARATDLVFKENNGDYGLICVTSLTNTDSQQQLFKYTKSLEKKLKTSVNPYIYCDSLVRFNVQQRKRGRPSKSSLLQLSGLNKESVNAINILGALQVFTISDIDDFDFYKNTVGKTKVQFFNDDGGKVLQNLSSKEKIQLLERCTFHAFEILAGDKNFWLTTTIAKDLQKKFLLDVCNTYLWLKENDLISDERMENLGRKVLDNYTLDSHVNLEPKEKRLITQAKESLGLEVKKLRF